MGTEIRRGEGRMERKKRELRQKIIKVAIQLFEQQGFSDTTMEQIAEGADVARKTLYNYFTVKEAIVDEYVRGISKNLAQKTWKQLQTLPDTRSRLLSALNNSYGWAEINPELTGIVLAYRYKTTFQNSGNEVEITGTQSIVAEIIRLGQEAGEIRPDVHLELIVRYIDLLRGTIVWKWLQDPSRFQLREEMNKMVDILLNGISTGRKPAK